MTPVQHLIGPNLWIRQDPSWSAVMETLALPLFSDRERHLLMTFIDIDGRQVDWEGIHRTARDFSHEQRILLRIAHALFNGGDCQLSELGEMSNRGRAAAILVIGQRYR